MTIFVLAFDIKDKQVSTEKYERLKAELLNLNAHEVQRSLWAVNLNNTAKDIIDHFSNYLSTNDRLWVSAVRVNHYQYRGALSGTNNWFTFNKN